MGQAVSWPTEGARGPNRISMSMRRVQHLSGSVHSVALDPPSSLEERFGEIPEVGQKVLLTAIELMKTTSPRFLEHIKGKMAWVTVRLPGYDGIVFSSSGSSSLSS